MAEDEDAESRKKALFDGLYALDSDDEIEDTGLLASARKIEGKRIGDPTLSSSRPLRRAPRLARSYSAISTPSAPSTQSPNPRRTKNPRQILDEFAVKDTPSLQHRHTITGVEESTAAILPTSSAPLPSSSIPMIGSKKRKREAKIKVLPEDQQIFRNLQFYFFPNSDTHPGRALRIVKALELGATWQKEFSDRVTHVIADNNMTLEYLLKHLKVKELPDVVLVNENYTASCMDFGRLVDPSSIQFRVKGHVTPTPAPTPSTEHHQPSSPELKPAKKAAQSSQQSPSRTEQSSSLATPTSQPQDASFQKENVAPEVDDLDAAIQETKETVVHTLASSDDEEDDQAEINEADVERRKKNKTSGWQERFQCMHKHTGKNDQGPNAHTMSVLQELSDYYEQTRDQWRAKSYRQAVAALRNHPTKVTTKDEAMRIYTVGASIAEKIEEIVVTNHLRKLDYTKLDERQQTLTRFMKVYGVGLSIAEKWASAGYKTLEDVLEKAVLTTNQQIGIEHYDDFNTRIPRAEVERHANTVKTALEKLDPLCQVYTMGSYRRGAISTGDIDIIITKKGASMSEICTTVMDRLVPSLTKSRFLVAALAQTSKSDGSKWHGASCLPGMRIWRRIDFLLVPETELGAALIYFTGNDIFNRSLRLLASKKGMRLNQRGLYKDVLRDYGREKLSEGTLVEGADERKIFEALGVPWRPPEHRIC